MKRPADGICLMAHVTLGWLKMNESQQCHPSIGDAALDATGDPHDAGQVAGCANLYVVCEQL